MDTQPDQRVGDTMRRLPPTTIALIAAGLLLLGFMVFLFTRGSGDEDRLSDEQAASNAAAGDPEALCADQGLYDRMKRDLFRRAAALRGSDQAAYDSLAAYAALRAETPILREHDEATGRVACSAYLSLDLPPGVAVAGGRRTLNAEVGFTVQPAADGSGNVLTLTNAESIVTPLATLMRIGAAPDDPLGNTDTIDEPTDNGAIADPLTPVAPPEPEPTNRTDDTATTNPSFNCGLARTRGEIAVCNSDGLAALDRQMAAQYRTAVARATPAQRALLIRTRDRFLAYRDGCRSDDCIADAYRGRMSEIRDIMAGRWQPPR